MHVRELKIKNRRRTKDLENLKNLFPGRSSGGGDLREDFSIVNETDRLAGRTSCDACPVTRPREINQSVGCVLTREGEGGAGEDPLSLEISRDPVSFRLPFAFRGSIRFHVHVNEAGMSLLPGGLIKFQGVITRSM